MKLKQKNLWSGEEKNVGAPTGGRREIFPGGGKGMDKFSAGKGVGELPSIPPSRENPAKWVYYSSSHV